MLSLAVGAQFMLATIELHLTLTLLIFLEKKRL
jgi:hypothetical protein